MIRSFKKAILWVLRKQGFDLAPYVEMDPRYRAIRDAELYSPFFSPWMRVDGEFKRLYDRISQLSLISRDRAWVLYCLARQACSHQGAFVECGVYRGGSAMMLHALIMTMSNIAITPLHLFDSFEGMPPVNRRDLHKEGDFADTSVENVRALFPEDAAVFCHAGRIPDTFGSDPCPIIAFAHIDVDIYQSVLDCCSYIYDRLVPGGIIVFDDYGFASCPGAREAVDLFFADKPEFPLCLMTGQALVIKL